ncbi:MAG: 1-acyl-sn-glycerol-3-phosphate acyltransferase [Chloroflexi bacterium]|nr:1-acyl-sn-glycerol-3-phosphate acyltransferase [Chloroflexota bacterium]
MGWLWGRFSIFAYWIATTVVYWFIRTFARLEVVDASNVPAEGRVLVVANHLSNFDPVLVAACSPRQVRTMAKREMFETPLVGWTVWAYGAFPVRRHSADMGALRVGRNHLLAGRAVLVFPEGTRAPERALIPALPGSAMLALLGDAPVVPVAVNGTEALSGPGAILGGLLRGRPTVRVRFGEPFALAGGGPSASRAEEGTDQLMRRIAALLPERYRGAYGPGSEGQIVVARGQDEADEA